MSALSKRALLLALVRVSRKHQPRSNLLGHVRTSQTILTRPGHLQFWPARYFSNHDLNYPSPLNQGIISTEERSKEDEYPPLPKYIPYREPEAKDVFIVQAKGLPWSCTAEDILKFFSDCRVRGGAQGIHIIHKNGRATGQAFIELTHEDDVGKALDQHRRYLGQRYVEVYEVTNKDAESILNSTEESAEPREVVRLRGLPFSCTEKDIVQFFSGLEIVEGGVTICQNRRGRNSGDAFVQFTSVEMAEKALEKDRDVIGNRYIEIFPSRKSEIQTQYKKVQNGSVSPAFDETNHSMKTAISSTNPAVHQTFSKTDNLIHMRGLPYGARGEDIVKFFAPIGLARILMEYGPDGRLTGEAEAYFMKHQDAVLAMAKDRHYILGRYIELFLNSSAQREEQSTCFTNDPQCK